MVVWHIPSPFSSKLQMLTRRGIVIQKADLDLGALQKLKKDLLVQVPQSFGAPNSFPSTQSSFRIFLENQEKLCIPRYFGWKQQMITNINGDMDISDIKATSKECPSLVFAGTLNTSKQQDKAVEAALNAFNHTGGGILSLPTGYGKTVVGIALMCKLQYKTIIVVHKDFLVEQWIERIKTFCPLAKIGVIRQSKTDVEDKDVVIAMLQSLSMKDYDNTLFNDFGLAIFDEVHHLSAPVFSKALFKLCCPYILGLSATPERKDGLTWVIESFIGPLFFKIQRNGQDHVMVNTIKIPFNGTLPKCEHRNIVNNNEVINMLISDRSRNAMILQQGLDVSKDASRRLLVLTDRRSHCQDLLLLFSPHAKSFIYYGGMSSSVLEKNRDFKVMVSTFSFVNEGLDISELNAIMLCTPKSDIVQAVGRILREGSHSGTSSSGVNPLIIDVVDWHTYFKNKYKLRKAYYKKAGFTVKDPTDESQSPISQGASAFAFVE